MLLHKITSIKAIKNEQKSNNQKKKRKRKEWKENHCCYQHTNTESMLFMIHTKALAPNIKDSVDEHRIDDCYYARKNRWSRTKAPYIYKRLIRCDKYSWHSANEREREMVWVSERDTFIFSFVTDFSFACAFLLLWNE